VAKFLRTQLLPSTAELEPTGIEEGTIKEQFAKVKGFCDKLLTALDASFHRIANIPFNQSHIADTANTGNADTEFAVTHYLGRVPTGFILVKSNKACNVYDSGTAWTTSAVYLKCDAANAVIKIAIF